MRDTQICPQCRGRKFFVQPVFRLPRPSEGQPPLDLPSATVSGLAGRAEPYGSIESWTCAVCGLTQLYASTTYLAAAARANPEQVRVVDASASSPGPFR